MLNHSILFKNLSGPYIEFNGKYSLQYFTNISNFRKWVRGEQPVTTVFFGISNEIIEKCRTGVL